MKITFTGITKIEAIDRLDKAAHEQRSFADRIGANYRFASEARKANARADHFSRIADILRASGDKISMSDSDESFLYLALAKYEHTFDASYRMYTITPESESEVPYQIMLAEGEHEAQKTE